MTGDRWLNEIGNVERDNPLVADRGWPEAARRVIEHADVRP